MTTFVYIDNYRGFSQAWIPLSRVNFLVGENSTGKTSFIELLEMFCYAPFWLFEPRFGVPGSNSRHFNDLVSASSKKRTHFTIGSLCVPEKPGDSCSGMLVTYQNHEGRPAPKRVSIIDGGSIRTVDGKLWVSRSGEKYRSRTKPLIERNSECATADHFSSIVDTHHLNTGFTSRAVSEEMQGSPLFFRCEELLFKNTSEDREVSVPPMFRTNLVELAPIRTKPKRTYDSPQTEFSPEGDHTPYVIRKRLTSKTHAVEFSNFLEKIGKDSGLFESISVKNYGNDPLSPFEIKIVLGKTALGLDNVGYGVSQALPVIVEMFIRPERTMFTVQQPEVHLHPKAQASIGDLIAEISRSEEKKFVVETHSDFTIDRFRLNVRKKGSIPSQLLFFERVDSGNRVTPITINDQGSLPDDQPESYRDFFFNESLSLLG